MQFDKDSCVHKRDRMCSAGREDRAEGIFAENGKKQKKNGRKMRKFREIGDKRRFCGEIDKNLLSRRTAAPQDEEEMSAAEGQTEAAKRRLRRR